MNGELIYEKPYCKIFYLKVQGLIYTDLIGSFTLEEYKDIFNSTLNAILDKKASGMILDQTRSKGGSLEARGWLLMDWLPLFKAKVNNPGFRIAGINNEKTGIKRFIADYLEKAAKKLLPFEIKACATPEEAIAWFDALKP